MILVESFNKRTTATKTAATVTLTSAKSRKSSTVRLSSQVFSTPFYLSCYYSIVRSWPSKYHLLSSISDFRFKHFHRHTMICDLIIIISWYWTHFNHVNKKLIAGWKLWANESIHAAHATLHKHIEIISSFFKTNK